MDFFFVCFRAWFCYRLRLPQFNLLQNFLKSVYFTAAFSFADALKVQICELRGKHLVNNIDLSGFKLIVFYNELEFIFSFEGGGVTSDVLQINYSTTSIITIEQLLSRQVD